MCGRPIRYEPTSINSLGQKQPLGKVLSRGRIMGSDGSATDCRRLELFLVLLVPDLWFPKFDFVALGIHYPSERPVFVILRTL